MKNQLTLILAGYLLFSSIGVAYAERFIVLNGQRLSIPEIQRLEQFRCGPIPNGRYWLNMWNGIWGYEGNPSPQGHIKDNCYNPQRRPSLSERGMLFSPRDWVR